AESARFLSGHTDWFLRLGTPGGYSPEPFAARAARRRRVAAGPLAALILRHGYCTVDSAARTTVLGTCPAAVTVT
ncbi:MAG TPA: hypothetical protein VHY31_10060, partial [Streptosporangiaceae bacterium]|nr:hypothetical protein [Streptosporangiaceae bacterium]